MPKKVMKTKRKFKKRHFKRSQKPKNKVSKELIVYNPGKSISPLPPKYRTKLCITNYWSTGTGGSSNIQQASFYLNQVTLPFNIVTTGSTVRGTAVATQNPTGLTQLMNINTYQSYRVYASAIEIDVMPGSSNDQMVCTITPSIVVNQPANIAVSEGAPYTRRYEVNSARTSNNNKTLKNFITVHKLIGTSRRAIEDDLSARFTGSYTSNPTVQAYWVINMNTMDGQALVSNLGFRVTLTFYVEFFGIEAATMVQT